MCVQSSITLNADDAMMPISVNLFYGGQENLTTGFVYANPVGK